MIVAPWKFDVLETSSFASRANVSAGQLSADSSSTETIYRLNRNLEFNRNTRQSVEELEKAAEILVCSSYSHFSSRLVLNFHSLSLDTTTVHVIYFLIIAKYLSCSSCCYISQERTMRRTS